MSTTMSNALPSMSQWAYQGYTDEQIVDELRSMGYTDDQVTETVAAFRKAQRAARSTRGFYLMVLGAVLGFISCILTLTGVFPEYRDLIMVGLTSVAIGIAVLGCYYVFE